MCVFRVCGTKRKSHIPRVQIASFSTIYIVIITATPRALAHYCHHRHHDAARDSRTPPPRLSGGRCVLGPMLPHAHRAHTHYMMRLTRVNIYLTEWRLWGGCTWWECGVCENSRVNARFSRLPGSEIEYTQQAQILGASGRRNMYRCNILHGWKIIDKGLSGKAYNTLTSGATLGAFACRRGYCFSINLCVQMCALSPPLFRNIMCIVWCVWFCGGKPSSIWLEICWIVCPRFADTVL